MGGCGPHCCIRRHSVGADSDSLDICRRSRNLVRCHSARSTRRSTCDRAEEIATRAIGRSRNTISVLVANVHAVLNRVGRGQAAVRGVILRTREALTAIHGECGTIRVGVVPVVVCWTKSLSRRSDCGGGWRRNCSTTTVGWREIARGAWYSGAPTIRRR